MTGNFEIKTARAGTAVQGVNLGRRSFVLGLTTMAVSGCMATPRQVPTEPSMTKAPAPKHVVPPMYYALPNERFPIPAVDIAKLDRRFWRTDVDYPTNEVPGTLIVDTPAKYLYHVKPNGRATRYGIGVGRDGFSWAGRAIVAYKREWPRWTPPDSMVARQPSLEPYSIANGGMDPGLKNPLGARSLYIHKDGKDTLYRVHGTPEAGSIGKAVSSGCIRLVNQDVVHLHGEVRDGSRIVVIPDPAMEHLLVG
ncbi:L,D-transpeptidase [Borborobacter arsenicus]